MALFVGDPETAAQYAEAIENFPHFTVVAIAQLSASFHEHVESLSPSLVVIDLDLVPDKAEDFVDRLSLLACDVIVLGSRLDSRAVRSGFSSGVFAFLVKPFEADHLYNHLRAYAKYRREFQSEAIMSQERIDFAMRLRHSRVDPQGGATNGQPKSS